MNIGEFKNVNGQFLGSIATLAIDLPKLGLRPVQSPSEKAPAFEIVALNAGRRWVQMGALWEATANETGEAFYQGKLEDPALGEAFAALRDRIVEAPGRMAERAAEIWLALPEVERERTMLFASGRQHKSEVNRLVQQGRLALGELGATALKLDVLDRVNMTREEQIYVKSYEPGAIVSLPRGIAGQKLAPGEYKIIGSDRVRETITLRGADGSDRTFRPGRLSPGRNEDSIRVYRERALELRGGDRLRWGDNDKQRGLYNAAIARVLSVDPAVGITVETAEKITMTLAPTDPMLRTVDLGYALNAHMAQGVTADRGIAVMDSQEKHLANERLALVTLTRVRDDLIPVVDNHAALDRAIAGNRGDKTSALEITGAIAGEAGRPTSSQMPLPVAHSRPSEPSPPEIQRQIDGGGGKRQMEFDI